MYEFTDMPEAVLNFALSLGSDVELTLFPGGVLTRYVGTDVRCSSSPVSIIATIQPEAIESDPDAVFEVEYALSVSFRDAVTAAGLDSPEFGADEIEDHELCRLWPDLSFAGIWRETEVAA